MFGIQNYASFVLAVLVFQLVPGAGTIAILNATARNGARAGMAAVAGTLITTWLVPAMTRHSYAPIFILAAAIVPLGVLAVWLLAGSRAPLSTPNEEGMHA